MLRSNAPKYGDSAQGQLEANDIALLGCPKNTLSFDDLVGAL